MLRQETELEKQDEADKKTHLLWESVTLKDGTEAFFNSTGGHLVRQRPRFDVIDSTGNRAQFIALF